MSANARSVTDRWLAAAPALPRLTDSAAVTAEKLLLLLHYGIDWSDRNWVTSRRDDYWDEILPSRVRTATYTSGVNLHQWWSAVARNLGSAPRNSAERSELAGLLTSNPKPVLQTMRDQAPALVLRTRIVAAAVREHRQEQS
ncbi:hypothetical protein [Rhodococcus pyridinivorans]|uniref:hypothetical protein n=1 Tax=Rhodococcus pyridinivorans TaxID=103816 RepID=UPI00265863F4|nr:hypothetical protein [Rhodococcus pyridinivorans]